MKIEKVFLWRELSSDGLLKAPDPVGPYYDSDNSLSKAYPTEESALNAFLAFATTHGVFHCSPLTLVSEYYASNE